MRALLPQNAGYVLRYAEYARDFGELEDIVVHPPMKRFVQRWRPGDPALYLGSLWIR